MATTKVAPSIPLNHEADMVWGWSKKQYLAAWHYFKDHELVVDKSLSMGEQCESYLAFLSDLQSAWLTEFQFDPFTGPMQVYDPEIDPLYTVTMDGVFRALKIQLSR